MARDFSNNYLINGFPWWGTRPDSLMMEASESATNHPITFVKLSFDSADVNFHSGLGDITWGGDTYTGTGRIGSISGIEESAELGRTPITMTLEGLPTTLLAAFLAEQYQGRTATVYFSYLNMTTYQLVETPIILFRGLMDTPSFSQGETLTITLSVESRFSQWDRPQVRRYTNEDQRSRYPSDTGFQAVEQSTEKKIVWGQKNQ
jgi:hypothetical protein